MALFRCLLPNSAWPSYDLSQGERHANEWEYDPDYRWGFRHRRRACEAFHALGNQVIIAGRRQQVLEEAIAANPGMKSAVFDIGNEDAIRSFAARLAKDYPGLNAVIHNAGIMRPEDLKRAGSPMPKRL